MSTAALKAQKKAAQEKQNASPEFTRRKPDPLSMLSPTSVLSPMQSRPAELADCEPAGMPAIASNSHLDWFMNPLPAARCQSTAAVRALDKASEATTARVLALLEKPDAQISAGLCKLPLDQLTRLNEIVTAARFHVCPLGHVKPVWPPPDADAGNWTHELD